MKLTLKSQILTPFLALIFLTSVAIIGSVLIATRNNINIQLEQSLLTGQRVFERLMTVRGDQLISSSEIVIGDFGFKSAIASKDTNTILSALDNYQKRLDIDLMMIHKIDGSLIASTLKPGSAPPTLSTEFIATAKKDGGMLTTIVIDGTAYQIAILPVMAPTNIAWATVGAAIDTEFASELKKLTNLDISFIGTDSSGDFFNISTLQSMNYNSVKSSDPTSMSHFVTLEDEEFLSLPIEIAAHKDYKIRAYIYSSLTKAYAQYIPLQWRILGIAFFALIISAIGALIISKNITQPIAFFVHAAKRISDGNYTENPDQTIQNTQEIHELQVSFRKMQKGISDRESKILYRAYHDTLTGLPNRTNIKKAIDALIEKNDNAEVSVVSINIVGFSQINDTFGFDVGDSFLKTFSTRLQCNTHDRGMSARLSADDFITLIPSACKDTLLNETQRLQATLEESINISGIDIAVSVRIGIATYPEQGENAEQLLRRSGIALHVAETGKRNIAFYEMGEEKEHMKRIRLIADLSNAIKNDDLVMYYQPKIDLQSQTVSQVEALIRWIHADLGFIPPDDFIGLAESSGMMPDLTRWVLTSVAKQTREWRKENINTVVAVNLSAHDIAHDGLPAFITQLLTENQLEARDIMLEITESAVMDNPDYAIGILHQFKALGLDLSIDDFGTGYSSLSQLKSMPVDELKIDKSFILNLEHNKDDQIIVQSTIQLGHNIGLRIVAEGVETQEAWHLLEQWGCDKLQGYFISRPMPAKDFSHWFNTYQAAEYCLHSLTQTVDSINDSVR